MQRTFPTTSPTSGGYVAADPTRMRSVLPSLQSSNVIYLNGCFDGGCTITPGFESSIMNRSSIIGGSTRQIPAFDGSPETWEAIVDCVRSTYAPFDVVVTDQDPSPAPHFEAIVAGTPSDIGRPNGVAGVAPFDTRSCGVIENVITFTFANSIGDNVDAICWTAAQEIAHGFGLDHEFLCADPMTYLSHCGPEKRFQNQAVRCGEFLERDCECGQKRQNSFKQIMKIFGPREQTPPLVTITEPKNRCRCGSRVCSPC